MIIQQNALGSGEEQFPKPQFFRAQGEEFQSHLGCEMME